MLHYLICLYFCKRKWISFWYHCIKWNIPIWNDWKHFKSRVLYSVSKYNKGDFKTSSAVYSTNTSNLFWVFVFICFYDYLFMVNRFFSCAIWYFFILYLWLCNMTSFSIISFCLSCILHFYFHLLLYDCLFISTVHSNFSFEYFI